MTIDLTEIIVAVITLLVMVFVRYAIPGMKASMTTEQQTQLHYWLTVAVQAAEEAGRMGILPTGKAKFEYAKKLLADKGYTFDEVEVTALINSTVWEVINQFKDDEVKVGGSE
jgi:hypothetical protein